LLDDIAITVDEYLCELSTGDLNSDNGLAWIPRTTNQPCSLYLGPAIVVPQPFAPQIVQLPELLCVARASRVVYRFQQLWARILE
jgi:hypothetical protein